jgi:hypothetical protein
VEPSWWEMTFTGLMKHWAHRRDRGCAPDVGVSGFFCEALLLLVTLRYMRCSHVL